MDLTLKGVRTGYGRIEVLHGIDCVVGAGDIVTMIGANGAGKSTLLKVISGLAPLWGGSIEFEGTRIDGMSVERIASMGVVQIPEGRQLFGPLTVEENLELGAYTKQRRGRASAEKLDEVFTLFPLLKERRRQQAGTLSGGEQQMVAIGRGLMADPTAIMLDEPSIGLAPKVVSEIMEVLARLCSEKQLAVLLVEQNVRASFKIAHRATVLHRGRVALSGTPAELIELPEVRDAYLGGGTAA